MYHRVREVRATHIILERKTIIVAFIESTDLHAATTRCQRSGKLSMPLQKDSETGLFK